MSRLSSRHLLGLEGVAKEDISLILETAVSFREVIDRTIKKVPTLRGVTVLNLFYEPSTRTRISFELAEKRLSADTRLTLSISVPRLRRFRKVNPCGTPSRTLKL